MPGEPPRRGFALRGLVAGIGAGALCGLLDAARAAGSSNEILRPEDALGVVGLYAAAFAPCGVAAGLVARRFAWPHRMLELLVIVGAAWFFVVAWANVAFLPGFTAGLSVAFDLAAAAVALLLLRARYRAPGEDASHTRRWFALAVVSPLLAAGFPHVFSARAEGPAPQASAAAGAPRPNVLVYVVDTLRADHLSAYGYARATSPELDLFAKDAVRFEDCRAPSSWTKPSVASLFTGLYPSSHACHEIRDVLPSGAETLAEVFRAAGWRTGAFVDNRLVARSMGFAQGFERFEEDGPSVLTLGTLLGKALWAADVVTVSGRPAFLGDPLRRWAPKLHAELLEFADARDDRPFFAYVHAMEPHDPYEPARADAEAMGFPRGAAYEPVPPHGGLLPFHPAPALAEDAKARLVAQYDGAIRGWSRHFGALVEALRSRGRLADTVIVVLADHGEEFHEHGGWTHGQSLFRELLHVPLIVRLPDSVEGAAAGRGRTVDGIAHLLDVAPTLTDVCGISWPGGATPGHAGRSLAPHLRTTGGKDPSRTIASDRPILAEVTQQAATLRSIRSGRWLLVRAKEPFDEALALYDEVSDRGHLRDRRVDRLAESAELEAKLRDAFHHLEVISLRRETREIDPDTAAALRGLGYTTGD